MAHSDDVQTLLARAADDLEMVLSMRALALGADQIFGFLAQQCVEKAAKAWLIQLGVQPDWTHDLRKLLPQLVNRGLVDRSEAEEFVELNRFAVEFRYGPAPRPGLIDRSIVADGVNRFFESARAACRLPTE